MAELTRWLERFEGPITQLLLKLGAKRTSVGWYWGRIVSFATAVASYAVPWTELGVSPTWQARIHVAAIIILLIAGKYGTSPLPKGDDK